MTKLAEDISEIKTDVSETKTDMKWVKEVLKRHISQHFQLRLAVVIALIAAGGAVLIVIL